MPPFYADAAQVPLTADRPLLIVDADEVLLLFADGFDKFLAEHACYFDFSSYHLFGNVRRKLDDGALANNDVTTLLDEFRDKFVSLKAVDGAVDAITELSPQMNIVVLSNMAPSQAPARLQNFSSLGLSLPLVINSGSKGAAVAALAKRTNGPVFFVDDIPRHLADAAELAPDVFCIHLVGDERLRPKRPFSEEAHLRADTWPQIVAFIRQHLAAAQTRGA